MNYLQCVCASCRRPISLGDRTDAGPMKHRGIWRCRACWEGAESSESGAKGHDVPVHPPGGGATTISRRDAVRSMAAFVIAPGLLGPLKFRPRPLPGRPIDDLRCRCKPLFDGAEAILRYRTSVVTTTGEFAGPAILGVAETDAGIEIRVQDCEVREKSFARAIRLYAEDGEFRGDHRFSAVHLVNPGDVLKITVFVGAAARA